MEMVSVALGVTAKTCAHLACPPVRGASVEWVITLEFSIAVKMRTVQLILKECGKISKMYIE